MLLIMRLLYIIYSRLNTQRVNMFYSRSYADGTQNLNDTNEVFVRTSVGSYRFEGISREFTRKLYDWERYRGISPTSSTFRLLGPAYVPFLRRSTIETSTDSPTSKTLIRSIKQLDVSMFSTR